MKKNIIISLILLTSISLFAQGSSYTRLGIGDLISSPSARAMGFGGLAIGSIDKFSINEVNPASWSGIDLTRFQISLNYLGKSITDSHSESLYSEASFSGFSVAVPLERDLGLVSSFGILPVSRVDYSVNSLSQDPNFGNITREYSGKGGISKMYIGTSYKLPFDLTLGATFEYYFGKIDYKSSVKLPDTLHFSNVTYTLRRGYSGIGASFGLLSPDLSKLLNSEKISDMRLGLSLTLPSKINTDTSVISTTTSGPNDLNNGLAESYIPMKIGFGASVKYGENLLFVADYLTQNWTEYSLADTKDSFLNRYTRFNFGVEILGEQRQYATFWEQMSFRFGLRYEQTQYIINSTNIAQYSLHTGLSFPLGVANTIDVGIVAGLRGKKENQLLLEKFFGTSVSLNFGELWFVRRRK